MLSWHGCTIPAGSAATMTVHKASNPRPHVAAWGCHGGLLDRPSRSNCRAWKTGCGSFARFCFLVLSHFPLISHVLVQICLNAPLSFISSQCHFSCIIFVQLSCYMYFIVFDVLLL